MSPELIRKPLHYDRMTRRVWIYGQRCHHGATGVLICATGVLALAIRRAPALAAVLASGGALMAHDWHDRSYWFKRGWQD